MLSKYHKIILILFLLVSITVTGSLIVLNTNNATINVDVANRLYDKSKEALSFCKANNYNTDFCILVDMRIHSGKHRMFVWNFKESKIEHKSLCAHGAGKGSRQSSGAQPKFSNINGSLLSSLGKYRLGIRAGSKWGIKIHYKMHGLESTNNNAFDRIIVLHSFTPVPEKEIYPLHLPMGWSAGCPVTDDATMRYLDKKLKAVNKPVLLWIYY